jgi:hypothetical protein
MTRCVTRTAFGVFTRSIVSVSAIDQLALTYLFVASCLLAGFGGALGSIVGHAAGQVGLWVGGVVGGLLGSVAAAALARANAWITHAQFRATAIGAGVGFLIAATIAVNTLSSPIGPVLSTALVGIGAVLGARTSS